MKWIKRYNFYSKNITENFNKKRKDNIKIYVKDPPRIITKNDKREIPTI